MYILCLLLSLTLCLNKDDGGYQQSSNNDYPSYGGGGGGGYRDRGYGRQDRYNQDSRYDSKPQVNESGKIETLASLDIESSI